MKRLTTRTLILLAAAMGLSSMAFAKDEGKPAETKPAAAKPVETKAASKMSAAERKAEAERKAAEEDQAARNAAKIAVEEKKQQIIDMAAAEEKRKKDAELKEARRLAAIEKIKERKIKQEEWERRCVIKTAMSDAEIAICREVKTGPAP
jgi:hypothetical protein